MATNPTVDNWVNDPPDDDDHKPGVRRIKLTPASEIKPRRVRWLWKDRIAYGTLALLAGREGLGKSTLGYSLAAQVTKGTLEGEDHGNPRCVLVCASEDSWEHTIIPRLIAAGADLNKIYRTEMITHDHMTLSISLPKDFLDVEYAASTIDAGLMILDPLMSVIDSNLDTHRDREVRQALEPLASLADRCRMAIVGLIHHNKSGSTDALQLVMGSKAFAAVARSVHTCIPDPDDETQNRRLFATSKNNLGRLDLPVLGFNITSHAVETEDDGTAWTGRINWTGEVEGNMHELMTRSTDPERGATDEAAEWLKDYLATQGGEAAKTDIEKAGRVAGHATRTLSRARERLRLEHHAWGFPRRTHWSFPTPKNNPETTPQPLSQPNASDANDTPSNGQTPVVPITSDPASGATVVPTMAPLGTTGPDLHKHENPPRVRAHTRGESLLGTTEGMAQLVPHSETVVPHHGVYAQGGTTGHNPTPDYTHPPPLCPDCEYPIDTNQHTTICEDQ